MFQGDFVKMVPEKWEPGQRAAVVKHKDNLVGFGIFVKQCLSSSLFRSRPVPLRTLVPKLQWGEENELLWLCMETTFIWRASLNREPQRSSTQLSELPLSGTKTI